MWSARFRGDLHLHLPRAEELFRRRTAPLAAAGDGAIFLYGTQAAVESALNRRPSDGQ
jgi:hypothetical protein